MNKKILAAAAGALAGARALAFDLDSPASIPVVFASETVAPSGGADTTVSETIFSTLGFGITANSERYLRYDLVGTRFLAVPGLAITGQSGSGIVYVGGGVDKDFVIFEVIADSSTSISPADTATLSFGAASPNLTLDGQTVTAVYRQFFTAPGALNENPLDLLATADGTVFSFQPGTEFASTTVTTGTAPLAIDFAYSNTRFVGGKTRSSIGAFYVA